MNKKELLNELLKNFPEFKKDKKSLEKTLDFMLKNNPKIEIDTKFKKDLKNRLTAIGDVKQEKKSNYFSFLVPTFGFMFAMFGVFYIFSGVNFFHNGALDIKNIEKEYEDVSYDKTKGIDEVELLDFESQLYQENLDGEPSNRSAEKSDNDVIIEKDLHNAKTKTFEGKKEENNSLDNLQIEKISKQEIGEKKDTNLPKGGTTFPDPQKESTDIYDSQAAEIIGEDESFSDFDTENIKAYSSFGVMEDFTELTFKDFCLENNGDYLEKSGYQVCKVGKKACLGQTYIDGDCDWKEVGK